MWGSNKKVANDVTLISGKAEIIGDIRVSGSLQVEGHVKGNILADPDSAASVHISDKGLVEGQIRAPSIVINGEVKGDVFSSDHIELAKKAVVTGDVHYVMMEMVMGAKVNGKLLHVAAEKGKKAKPSKPEAAKPEAGKPETAKPEAAKPETTQSKTPSGLTSPDPKPNG